MMLLAGLCTAILVWWLVKWFTGAQPARIAKLARTVGGVAALGAAGLLMFRGRLDMAFLLGSGGAWLLGWNGLPAPFGGAASRPKSAGSTSRVRSASVEMELDHDSGRMTGRVVAGRFAGRDLDGLSVDDVLAVLAECRLGDPDGERLVETYLDRREPGWREAGHPDPDAGRRSEPKLGAMTQQEAHEVLGLQPGAGEADIRAAHRILMKKLHPDQGGSTYLASRVNQAKDVLLDRHG